MSRPRGRGPHALRLLEEAFHLLRRAPASALLAYYVGSLPFILAFLFFWAEMSQGAFARRHVAVGSLALALLYLWMKVWQERFARSLYFQLDGSLPPAGRVERAVEQAAVQPFSLVLLPIALLISLPFGWVYAFFQAHSLTGDVAAARRQALLWPRQNHLLIVVLALFGLFVFLNVLSGLAVVPFLLRMFLGLQTAVSRSPETLFNSTFLAVCIGITYLAMGPLTKAVYVVRGFHGEARTTGRDLRAAWRRAAVLALLAVAPTPVAAGVGAAEAGRPAAEQPSRVPAGPTAAPVVADELDHSLAEVLARREFSWRLRRQPAPEGEEQGLVARVVASILRPFRELGEWLDRVAERFGRWLERLLRQRDSAGG